MYDILHLKTISDLFKFLNLGFAEHPLIGVVDFSNFRESRSDEIRIKTDFYAVMFKNYCRNHLRYGRKTLDFQDGSLVCIAPNQVITIDNEIELKEDSMGWGLFFHPDLIRGTSLGYKMKDFSFFSYEITEALHLSPSYLSDLLKKETGLNAQDHIHYYLIEQAKNILLQTNHTVSEIAYSLGFEYPQYFSRLFKQKTGKTPLEYRARQQL